MVYFWTLGDNFVESILFFHLYIGRFLGLNSGHTVCVYITETLSVALLPSF